MPISPSSIAITLSSSAPALPYANSSAYAATTLSLVLTGDVSDYDELRAELHTSQDAGATPVAEVEYDGSPGAGPHTLTFTAAQMNQLETGQTSKTFYLVVLGRAGSGASIVKTVLAARNLELIAAPQADTIPAPPPVDATWASDEDLTALEERVETLEGAPAVNLSVTRTSSTVTVVNSGGDDAVLSAADGSNAGVMTAANFAKLDGVASGATANSTDAQLRDRTTHTGTQAISSVSGLQTALDAKAPTASPTFTGLVTAASVVLSGNLDSDGTVSAQALEVSAGGAVKVTMDRTSGITVTNALETQTTSLSPESLTLAVGSSYTELSAGALAMGTGSNLVTFDCSSATAAVTITPPDISGVLALVSQVTSAVAASKRTYRPEDYGTVALDGSVDCRAAITAAINAAYAAGGGVVELAAGIYKVQPSGKYAIVLRDGVILKGQGIGQTTIRTDNADSGTVTTPYNLVNGYGFDTVTSAYTAEPILIMDLTLQGTSNATTGTPGNLHNLLAFANMAKGLGLRIGFENTGAHYAEYNQCDSCWLVDCATVGTGNHGTAKFQLDPNGQAGGKSDTRPVMTISNSASHNGGLQTLLTVNSTAGVSAGDFLVISGANGTAAAAYNFAGGWMVTEVRSSTQVAINMQWPTSVATPATTTGTATVEVWVKNNGILRYTDILPADSTSTPARTFLDLSHNNDRGCLRNFSLISSVIACRAPSTSLGTGTYNTIAFDSGAYPCQFLGLKIHGNTFIGEGATGQHDCLNLAVPADATRPHRRITGISVEDNVGEGSGYLRWLIAGAHYSDSSPRSMSGGYINDVLYETWGSVSVRRNRVQSVLRHGALTQASRAARGIGVGACSSLVMEGNEINWPNAMPPNILAATVSSVDTANDYVTFTAAHSFVTGDDVCYHSTSGYPGGMVTSVLYAIVVDSTTIRFATSLANAQANTYIDLTSAGSGTMTVTKGWMSVATGSNQWGFFVDHARHATVRDNVFYIQLNTSGLYFYPYVFACSGFEVAGASTTISGAATASSGLYTTLTVASSASFRAGDRVNISGANGTNAAVYNKAGGHLITSIPNGTSITIDLVWQGNATTAGTVATTAKRPFRAGWVWTNNVAVGGKDVSASITRPFTELTHSTTQASAWASTVSPAVAFTWKGNYAVTFGAAVADTAATVSPNGHLAVGATALTTTATTAAESETSAGTKTRHRGGYGPRTRQHVLASGVATLTDDFLITDNTHASITVVTEGGTPGVRYTFTRNPGIGYTITARNAAGATETSDTSTVCVLLSEP